MATFNLRKFTNPDVLKTIAPGRLVAFLSPWRGYLVGRGLDFPPHNPHHIDYDVLAHILMDPDASVPKEMVDALYDVHETASEEDMDALLDLAKSRSVKVEHDPRTTVADVAIQMWLAAPDMLREHHAEAIAFRQKNFLYYGGAHGEKRAFPTVDNELRLQIEAALDDWFEEHKRGRGCRIFLFPHGKKVWILIRQGLPMRREASHQDDGKSSTEFYRPQQHDVLIYDTSSDEMGVCTPIPRARLNSISLVSDASCSETRSISRQPTNSAWTRSSKMARSPCYARMSKGWRRFAWLSTAATGAELTRRSKSARRAISLPPSPRDSHIHASC